MAEFPTKEWLERFTFGEARYVLRLEKGRCASSGTCSAAR